MAPKMAGSHTVFVAVGNLFAYLCLAATLVFLGYALLALRRKKRDLPIKP
jgi:hypothetical protein